MSYQSELLKVFPYCFQITKLQARVFTDALLGEDHTDRIPSSSFAITYSTTEHDKVDLWLSLVSYTYLIKEFGLVKETLI